MNKKKLNIARNKVDQLDQKIFNLIKKRTQIVKYMLSLKKYKNQIVDHKRINTILKNVRNKSIKDGIDPKITRRIWTSIIWGFVDFQKKNFRKIRNKSIKNGIDPKITRRIWKAMIWAYVDFQRRNFKKR